jgi:hypothetical protein
MTGYILGSLIRQQAARNPVIALPLDLLLIAVGAQAEWELSQRLWA